MIKIVGLGPSRSENMSVGAYRVIRTAPTVFVRTMRHPAVEDLTAEGVQCESLDYIYESSDTFEEVYARIARRILDESANGDVVYAVPGHPLVGESAVLTILRFAKDAGLEVEVIGPESFIESSLEALGISIDEGLKILDALSMDHVSADPDVDNLIYQVYNREIASDVKLKLMDRYPDEFEMLIIFGGADPSGRVKRIPLYMLDRYEVDHLTSVYVPAFQENKMTETGKAFEELVGIMARLRGPDGCPWDREQTIDSLKKYVVEETYEVVDAIDAEDMDELRGELGDLLLQIVFQSELASEEGAFDIKDVIAGITAKLIRRHPHVFGDSKVECADEVVHRWEQIKSGEKGYEHRTSVLDGVPAQLPALMLAMEISKRAARTGFEWPNLEAVVEKLEEEVGELKHELNTGNQERIAEEIGDLLFTVVNVARWTKIDTEDALRAMTRRFAARFRKIEEAARESGKPIEEMTIEEMDAVWDRAKQEKS